MTKEMEPLLSDTKKKWFYDRTQSDMIRELVLAGLNALDEDPEKQAAQTD